MLWDSSTRVSVHAGMREDAPSACCVFGVGNAPVKQLLPSAF